MAVIILWGIIWMYNAFPNSCLPQTDTFLFKLIEATMSKSLQTSFIGGDV